MHFWNHGRCRRRERLVVANASRIESIMASSQCGVKCLQGAVLHRHSWATQGLCLPGSGRSLIDAVRSMRLANWEGIVVLSMQRIRLRLVGR